MSLKVLLPRRATPSGEEYTRFNAESRGRLYSVLRLNPDAATHQKVYDYCAWANDEGHLPVIRVTGCDCALTTAMKRANTFLKKSGFYLL